MAGRKSKYDELRVAEQLESVRGWSLHGGKSAVARALGVAVSTIGLWESRYPDFAEALKKGEVQSKGELLVSAFDMARGYEREVTEVIKVKAQRFDEKSGRVLTDEKEQLVRYKKFFPPDPRMNQFLLSNRMRSDYQLRPEPEEHEGNITIIHEVDRS